MSWVFAQENNIKTENTKRLKHEIALSGGDNMHHTIIMDEAYAGFGSYTLSYHYRIRNWLWCGAYFNVSPIKEYGYLSGYDRAEPVTTAISIAPSLRFSYFNKQNVSLYSAFSVGCSVLATKEEARFGVFYQITVFGFSISIGEKFFVGGEAGYGYKGLLCANFGYRF